MANRHRSSLGVWFCIAETLILFGPADESRADVFSIDVASPSVPAVNPADILHAGPGRHVTAADLGLRPGDNLDALSGGLDIVTGSDVIHFSIDRESTGVQGPFSGYNWDAFAQAILNQQAGDIFVTTNSQGIQSAPQGINYLDVNQHQFGLVPLGTMFPPLFNNQNNDQDNVDAYSMEEFNFDLTTGKPEVPVYFSLGAGSPTLAALGASAADILVYDPDNGLSVALSHTSMGLLETDDIDALALNFSAETGGPRAYYSLSRGSDTVGLLGASPADVFLTDFSGTGSSLVIYEAADLGLAAEDNVDALETNAIPEPAGIWLVLGGLVPVVFRRSRPL
jgi:hypothetical protein